MNQWFFATVGSWLPADPKPESAKSKAPQLQFGQDCSNITNSKHLEVFVKRFRMEFKIRANYLGKEDEKCCVT